MALLESSIVHDIFAEDGETLSLEYISGGLFLFGRKHTTESLINVLNQLEKCSVLTSTKEGYTRNN